MSDLNKGIDQNAHSLLHASNTTLPTVDYIRQIEDPEELEHLERRLKKLEQLYIRNNDIHDRITKLLHAARGRHFHKYLLGHTSQKDKSDE